MRKKIKFQNHVFLHFCVTLFVDLLKGAVQNQDLNRDCKVMTLNEFISHGFSIIPLFIECPRMRIRMVPHKISTENAQKVSQNAQNVLPDRVHREGYI